MTTVDKAMSVHSVICTLLADGRDCYNDTDQEGWRSYRHGCGVIMPTSFVDESVVVDKVAWYCTYVRVTLYVSHGRNNQQTHVSTNVMTPSLNTILALFVL
jgi:hypothetical protein